MINSPIDEIKNRLDVVEVIGSYVKLQKAGANYRGCCPFHSEKKPSFFVSPTRQIWHCFGCGKGGDIFGFVKEIEGMEFGDALRVLANKAGVELKKMSPEYAKMKTEKQKLYEICEWATKFFEKQLEEGNVGKEAKKYLLGRGMTEETLKKWRVGYAPDKWQVLSDFLASRGYSKEDVEKIGLGITSERESFYDRFRSRIIFPVFDINSQVIGFGGRIYGPKAQEEVAKYVNTPQTMLYDKGSILYGLDKAKIEIRKKDCCILVEGYVDLIMVSQAGYENVVATSGTALTPFQLKLLKRYSDNLLLAFDMDVAGDTATKRGINLAQAQGFNVKIITIPEGKDPADAILKDPKVWEESVNKAKSIMDFYFETTFKKFDKNTPDGKKNISKIILPVIKRIPNKIVQAHWIKELAGMLGVKEASVEEEMEKVRLDEFSPVETLEEPEQPVVSQKSRKDLLEERLLTLILKSPENNVSLINEEDMQMFSPKTREIILKLKLDPDFCKKERGELSDLLDIISLKSESEEMENKDVLAEIGLCLGELELMEAKNRLDNLSSEIKKAERLKDFQKVEELTKEFNSLIKNGKEKKEKSEQEKALKEEKEEGF